MDKMKVLIIDDDADIRERLKNILERKGYSVFTAADGMEGLKVVEGTIIDIIYCDIVMPRMDGLEFLDNVRKFNPRAEIIMVTGCSTMERCVAAIEKSACAYLVKPLRVADILESLSKAVRRICEKEEMICAAFVPGRHIRPPAARRV